MNRSLLRVLRTAPERGDAQLLAQYARHRDEDAFAQLVRRHAPMVLGVCRRVLGNAADADDAFQATFLVLARKAASLDGLHALAGWLHGVAFNIARKLRHMNAQRKARERPPAPPPEPPDPELLAALDEELNHLPEKYRTVIVLCDLEGLTRKEAALRLGCPEGTVAGRLARARSRLAAQLASRGLAPTVAGVAASQLAPAATPTLIQPILDAAALSPQVVALTEGVLKAMFLQKLRATLGVLVVCAVALVGFSRGATPTPDETPADPPQVKKADTPAEPPTKKLTVIPLRRVGAAKAEKEIRAALPRDTAQVIAVPGEDTLLVYADGATTYQIEAIVAKLGEVRKVGTVFRLRNAKAEEVAKVLREVFPGATSATTTSSSGTTGEGGTTGTTDAVAVSDVVIVPVPRENALIVYATANDTETIRKLLDKALDAPNASTKATPPKLAEPQSEWVVLRLRNAAASDATKMLSEVFNGPGPGGNRVRVTVDSVSNSLIVQAGPADLEAIRKLLEKVIDAEPAKGAGPRTSALPLTDLNAAEVATTLAAIYKQSAGIRITALPESNQLLVYADDATLKEIRAIIDQLQATAKPDDLKVKLLADVESLRVRVKWCEQMVKKGFMTPSQLAAEQAKLKLAEDLYAHATRKPDPREAEKQAILEAIAAVKKLIAFAEERAKKGEKDPWALGIYQTELKNLELQLERLQKPTGGR